MSVKFSVPALPLRSVYEDYRDNYSGGFGWRHKINLAEIKYIAIHHSVTTPKNSLKKEVEEVHRIHRQGRGWGGIGYNFIVSSEIDSKTGFARVAYVGDMGSARAHTPNSKGALGIPKNLGNNHIIGICIIGNYVNGKPNIGQLRTLHELCKELIYKEDKRLPGLKDWSQVKKHKDFDATACCGNWDLSLIEKTDKFPGKPKPEPKPEPEPSTCEKELKQLKLDYKSLEMDYQGKINEVEKLNKRIKAHDETSQEKIRKLNENISDLETVNEELRGKVANLGVQLQEEIKKNESFKLDKLLIGLGQYGITDGTIFTGALMFLTYLGSELANIEANESGVLAVIAGFGVIVVKSVTKAVKDKQKRLEKNGH